MVSERNEAALFGDDDAPVFAPVSGAPLAVSTLADILAEEAFPERVVPFGRGQVRIRGLTKGQVLRIRERATVRGEIDPKRLEMLLFLTGVVEPQLAEAHAEALLKKSFGAVDSVIREIMVLSGMLPEQMDAAARSFRA